MLGVSMAALIASGPALAQTPPEEPAAPETAPAGTGAHGTAAGRSRKKTPAQSSLPVRAFAPSPNSTARTQSRSSIRPLSAREGKLDTASTLQSSPIAAGSTQITAAISSNFVTNGGPGAQTIDLRGLGANRTLVLLNGRRAGPAGTRGGVSSFDLTSCRNRLPKTSRS